MVAFADIGDRVTVSRNVEAPINEGGLTVTRTGPFAAGLPESDAGDLVTRAAHSLFANIPDEANLFSALHIKLFKSLPIAAGIGGGSADAAATLRALLALTGAKIAPSRLHALALDLGADVPVCLDGTPTIMRGIGEDLTPFPALPNLGVVLLNPSRQLSTPAVFAGYKDQNPTFSKPIELPSEFKNTGHLMSTLADQGNDLSRAASDLMPEITALLTSLENSPNCLLARMSGSGATCFGLFDTVAAAQVAGERISADHADWWCAAGQLLAQSPPPKLL